MVRNRSSRNGGRSSNGRVRTARHFDIAEAPGLISGKQIARLRIDVLGVSQRLFAGLLNVAPQTVHAWEQGGRRPSGLALRLLSMARKHPETLKSLVKNRSNGRKRPHGDAP